jgi:cystathionine beta-lyase/cystathionine gamma-synthase
MSDQWDRINYPELSPAENEEIRRARRQGFAAMFSAYPNAEAQAKRTLDAARKFLNGSSI